ncbi:MAG: hypothetical protein K2W95_26070 [Candidatus Obscuribacterales bacterium]|nr:hypothetical protein [Candidatus Obscuribacterales bacterium]
MERLTISSALAESDSQSNWASENLLHPFLNGTGVNQLVNNFRAEKQENWHVPHAEAFSRDWAAQTLASAGGAVLTYAVAGKATGMGLASLGAKIGLEGGAARFMNSHITGQVVGAGLLDFAKSPNAGETRIGNAAGSVLAFGVFSAGNSLIGRTERIAQSNIYSGLGRIAVGAAGGLTGLETSRCVSRGLGSDAPALTWNDRWTAMTHGGFVNFALPLAHKTISTALEGPPEQSSVTRPADPTNMKVSRAAGDPVTGFERIPGSSVVEAAVPAVDGKIKVILLKQQFEAAPRAAQVEQVATELATFIGGAKKTLHTALYDLRLRTPKIESLVINALNERAEAGVDVKLAFFKPNVKAGTDGFVAGDTAAPVLGPSAEFLARLSPKIKTQVVEPPLEATPGGGGFSIPDILGDALGRKPNGQIREGVIDIQKGDAGGLDGVGTAGIVGGGKLMHHKYLVRDAGTRNAAVWTGSTNLTESAFGMQDNNIIQFKSAPLAKVFETNFGQLWEKGALVGTGKDLHTTVKVGDSAVSVAFSPGDGALIEADIARHIEAANTQVHIASMVISSTKILQALADKIDSGKHVAGIYDGPQMRNVANAWGRSASPESQVKIALWNKVKANLVAKNSHPYDPEGPHDFMHNKTLTVDNSVVITGSFNMSMNAMKNAENVVTIHSPVIAGQYTDYIKDLVQTYDGAPRRVAEK